MKKKAASVVATTWAMLLIAGVAQADGYGAAGCGLGSIVFGDKGGIIQVLAATTNGTFGNQTFSITTGTSNCSDSGGGAESAKAFIETNREALAKDIARGQGETISSLSTLAGCGDEAAVGSTLQQSFGEIFPEASVSDVDVSGAVLDTLRAHPELSCQQIG